MSAGSVASDLATALANLNANDTIIQGWVTQYQYQAGGEQFSLDGGNTAAGQLLNRYQLALRQLQGMNHG